MKFDDKEFIAQQIKIHRRRAGLTQAELAEKVNLSTQHISRIESACYIPSLSSFFAIVDVLNIDLRVFGLKNDPSENSVKNSLINSIVGATDAELILYDNVIKSISSSLSQIKTKLL